MMESRGGITGGATLNDFISGYAREGYAGSFMVRRAGGLLCCACEQVLAPEGVTLRSLRRVEGVSDPADMGAVAALECPNCGSRGTATFSFGPNSPPEDGLVLRTLDDQRVSARIARDSVEDDGALVRDTGWLPGPRNG